MGSLRSIRRKERISIAPQSCEIREETIAKLDETLAEIERLSANLQAIMNATDVRERNLNINAAFLIGCAILVIVYGLI